MVNPVNQLWVSELIAENWDDIQKCLKRSKTSVFRPRFSFIAGRAIPGINFDTVSRRRARILARYGRYIKTDVARFYPSVYTHSIPWALRGKAWVKANYKSAAFKASPANLLDWAVRSGQLDQTIGLPIGPDTSRILSELIATEVEEYLLKSLPDLPIRCVRYVDDMIVGVGDGEAPETILSHIESALGHFELELSAEKTDVHGVGRSTRPEWSHYLRTYQISGGRAQRDDLDSFFEQALFLSEANPRDGVLVYAVKRAAALTIKETNFSHLIRWMMYCCRRSGACFEPFAAFVIARNDGGDMLPNNDIKSFVFEQLAIKSTSTSTFEVAWLLFLARELKIELGAELLTGVSQCVNGTLALLAMDINQRGLVGGKLNESVWRKNANADGLKGEFWLGAYEITKKAWWAKPLSDAYIKADMYFSSMLAEDVYFYDEALRVRPIGRSPLAVSWHWGRQGSSTSPYE